MCNNESTVITQGAKILSLIPGSHLWEGCAGRHCFCAGFMHCICSCRRQSGHSGPFRLKCWLMSHGQIIILYIYLIVCYKWLGNYPHMNIFTSTPVHMQSVLWLAWCISYAGCVMSAALTTLQLPPSCCQPCGMELTQATTSPFSPASSSHWQPGRWGATSRHTTRTGCWLFSTDLLIWNRVSIRVVPEMSEQSLGQISHFPFRFTDAHLAWDIIYVSTHIFKHTHNLHILATELERVAAIGGLYHICTGSCPETPWRIMSWGPVKRGKTNQLI